MRSSKRRTLRRSCCLAGLAGKPCQCAIKQLVRVEPGKVGQQRCGQTSPVYKAGPSAMLLSLMVQQSLPQCYRMECLSAGPTLLWWLGALTNGCDPRTCSPPGGGLPAHVGKRVSPLTLVDLEVISKAVEDHRWIVLTVAAPCRLCALGLARCSVGLGPKAKWSMNGAKCRLFPPRCLYSDPKPIH